MGLTAAARRRAEGDTLKYFVEDPGTGTLYKRGQLLGQVSRPRPGGCSSSEGRAGDWPSCPERTPAVKPSGSYRSLAQPRRRGRGSCGLLFQAPKRRASQGHRRGAAADQTCPETDWSRSARLARSAKSRLLSALQPAGRGAGLVRFPQPAFKERLFPRKTCPNIDLQSQKTEILAGR